MIIKTDKNTTNKDLLSLYQNVRLVESKESENIWRVSEPIETFSIRNLGEKTMAENTQPVLKKENTTEADVLHAIQNSFSMLLSNIQDKMNKQAESNISTSAQLETRLNEVKKKMDSLESDVSMIRAFLLAFKTNIEKEKI